MKSINQARQTFKPNRIKCLFIAEAPPNAIERFFYFPDVKDKDFLFLGITEVLYPTSKQIYMKMNRSSMIKDKILNKFKDEGYFLMDLSDVRISQRTAPLNTEIPSLLKNVSESISQSTPIILIKANVYDLAYQPLLNAGCKVINQRIPFPSNGQQTNFKKAFKNALKLAGI